MKKISELDILAAREILKNRGLTGKVDPRILVQASYDLGSGLDKAIDEVQKIFDGRPADVFEKIKDTLGTDQR